SPQPPFTPAKAGVQSARGSARNIGEVKKELGPGFRRDERSMPLRSVLKLKLREAVKLFLDERLMRLRLAFADPRPFLHQQFLIRAVRFDVERSDDLVADQHRQREIAIDALFLRHISFEQMVVAEEELQPLALNDQRIERRENMRQRGLEMF